MISYLHAHTNVTKVQRFYYRCHSRISLFRTPIGTPSDSSECDIERLEPRLQLLVLRSESFLVLPSFSGISILGQIRVA
jgi:hypothetical protein